MITAEEAKKASNEALEKIEKQKFTDILTKFKVEETVNSAINSGLYRAYLQGVSNKELEILRKYLMNKGFLVDRSLSTNDVYIDWSTSKK
jgi:hypothetical protein